MPDIEFCYRVFCDRRYFELFGDLFFLVGRICLAGGGEI